MQLRSRHPKWASLISVAVVETTREIASKASVRTRPYISSRPAGAKLFALAARQHWGVESVLQTHTERSSR